MPLNIGIFCRLNWERPDDPFKDAEMLRFLMTIQRQLRRARIFAIDWRTIHADGAASAFDVFAAMRREICLATLHVIHIFNLGYSSNRNASLKEKWRDFKQKLEIINALGVRCINSIEAISYGIHKDYLIDLAKADLPMVPTKKVTSNITVSELRQLCMSSDGVVKPANGECGRLVLPLDKVTEVEMQLYRHETDDILLQPYMAQAKEGEKSLIFLGDYFSHAVLKIPPSWDIRANGPHTGALVQPYIPSENELNLASRVRSAFPYPLDTCRIDMVGSDSRPWIMEIEVVDPAHYCELDERHAHRVADFYYKHICD